MNRETRFVGHIPVMVNDIDETRDFYERVLGLRNSGTAPVGEGAINVMSRTAICFMSCGTMHHDFACFQEHDRDWKVVRVTEDDFHHLSFTLQDDLDLDWFKQHLASLDVEFSEGAAMPDPTGTFGVGNSVHFRDPNGHFVEVHSVDVASAAKESADAS
ncbi:MAG: VOC family protein [Acidobacteriota bacterium]